MPAVRHESQQDQTRHRLAVPDRKHSEVLVRRDEDATLGAAERQDGFVIGAAIGLEHVVNVMPSSPKCGNQARIAALVEQ